MYWNSFDERILADCEQCRAICVVPFEATFWAEKSRFDLVAYGVPPDNTSSQPPIFRSSSNDSHWWIMCRQCSAKKGDGERMGRL